MDIARAGRALTPPVVMNAIRRARRLGTKPQWEYAPDGWRHAGPGWNHPSVAATERARWADYVAALSGDGPPGVLPGARGSSYTEVRSHNRAVTDALVFALAGSRGSALSILDWGGGLGQLRLLAESILPEVRLEYHVADLPDLRAAGRELSPETHFDDPEEALTRTYDLVVARNSLQYQENWQQQLSRLASAATSYLFVSLLPIVLEADSYPALQRPYEHGYETEYVGWVFNRAAFLHAAASSGLRLRREFLLAGAQAVHDAPESFELRGFVFDRRGDARTE